MKTTYHVKVQSVEEIHELPDYWTDEDFKGILLRASFDDFDEIEPDELKDYAIMALQVFEADEAAALVLTYKLSEQLSKGQIQNLSHEMMEEKLWEEYSDIQLHKDLYACAVLLKLAFPRKFPETDAVKCVVDLTPNNLDSPTPINKTFLARLLATGMDDHAVINRLFDDQVNGAPFPEAEGIIWQFDVSNTPDMTALTVYSSVYWLHAMDEVDQYSMTHRHG